METNTEEAISLINTVYMRSNVEEDAQELVSENYTSKLRLDELYMRERQRELMFEGKRWFDLMRMARRVDSPAPLSCGSPGWPWQPSSRHSAASAHRSPGSTG